MFVSISGFLRLIPSGGLSLPRPCKITIYCNTHLIFCFLPAGIPVSGLLQDLLSPYYVNQNTTFQV